MKSLVKTSSSLLIALSFFLAPHHSLRAGEAEPKTIATYHVMTASGSPAGKLILCVGDITKLYNVDAIVNAANYHLEGGGGIDKTIHEEAGPELLAFNERIAGTVEKGHTLKTRCPEGEARISPAFKLSKSQHISYIISTNGPQASNDNRKNLLQQCYFNSINIAAEINSKYALVNVNISNPYKAWIANFQLFTTHFTPINSLAFPLISTGAFGYPIAEATEIALKAIKLGMKEYADTLQTLKASKPDNVALAKLAPLTVYIVIYNDSQATENVKIYQDALEKYLKYGEIILQPDAAEGLTTLASQLALFARTSH